MCVPKTIKQLKNPPTREGFFRRNLLVTRVSSVLRHSFLWRRKPFWRQ